MKDNDSVAKKWDLNIGHILLFLLILLFVVGLFVGGTLPENLAALWRLQFQTTRLLHDFIASSGIGATFMNAALVGFIGLSIIYFLKLPFSGSIYAAILTMVGFALFGKTPFNILPLISGVWLSAKLIGKKLVDYVLIALFGTALGPLVNMLAWELHLAIYWTIPIAIFGGIFAGMLLPSIALAMLHMHQGYTLYNTGYSCGFLALFLHAIFLGFGQQLEPVLIWSQDNHPSLFLFIPILCLLLFFAAWLSGRQASSSFPPKPAKQGVLRSWAKEWPELLRCPGNLPSDFIDLSSQSTALLNSSITGLSAFAYVWLVGAPFNGPVIGGMLTVMGFATFGIHIRNTWPVVLGISTVAWLSGNALTSPGAILAVLFGTSLGPLAGQFGIFTGLAAGVLNYFLAQQTNLWTGGLNLYNNGFASGLTATLIIAWIHWLKSRR